MEFVDGPDLRAFLHNAHLHSTEYLDSEAMCQGTASQLAEKLEIEPALCQGTASAVPQTQQTEAQALAPAGCGNTDVRGSTEGGGGFNPRIKPTQSTRALAPEKSLPVPLALSITRQIAEGLGAAHSKGMVHRDIKPENILMARNAGAWLPKIADFGIVATKESSTAYTKTGGTLLTMSYAAPEQWRGTAAAELDGRTDLYALGGLLYEMLTGQTPFHAENYEGWSRQHQTTPPQPPSTLRPDLANWQGLDALTLRLLAKDRNDRPKDVAELLGLIDAVRYLPPGARREIIIENAGKRADGNRSRRISIWIWAASVAMLVVAAIVAAQIFWPKPLSSAPGDYEAIVKIEQQAEALDKQNRYSEAIPLFNQACAGGIGEACNHLGYIYQLGGTGAKNYLMAAAFFTKACDAGNSDGCENLGGMYESGEGIVLDHSKAAALWSKACDAGNSDGCTDLGTLYDQGKGVKRDYHRAVALFSKACDSGRTLGCHNLGIMYLNGRGVAKDTEKARSLFKKCCEIGFKESCDEMKKLQK
jgi:tetratricopeptide (TPR) repeat protein